MSDEPRFIAKTSKYSLVKKENNLPQKTDFFSHIKPVGNIAPTIPTINLSSINADQLKDKLQQLMNDKSLTSNTFIFTSKRYNKKLELERDRINTVVGIIDRAIELNRNILNYNVDIFLTQQRLEYLAFRHAVDIEREARAVLREDEFLARQHTDNLDKVDDGYKIRQLEIEKIRLENERLRLENAKLSAQTDESRVKIDFIRDVLSQVDVKNMPPTLQAYVTATIINPNGTQFNDFDMQEQLKQFVIKEADAKSRMADEKAKQEAAQTKINEATSRNTVFNLDSIRNKPNS